jgi:hypothetical protein
MATARKKKQEEEVLASKGYEEEGKKVRKGEEDKVSVVSEKELEGRSFTITSDNEVGEVLELDDKGAELLFDDEALLALSDDEYKKLSRRNAYNYVLAENAKKQREKFEEGGGIRGTYNIEVIDPLDAQARKKISVRYQDKDGVHCVFKRPDEVGGFEELGYKQVHEDDGELVKRFPGAKPNASGYLRVKNRKGDDDLIPMVAKRSVSDPINEAPGKKSRYRISRGKEDFKDKVKAKRKKGLSVWEGEG